MDVCGVRECGKYSHWRCKGGVGRGEIVWGGEEDGRRDRGKYRWRTAFDGREGEK